MSCPRCQEGAILLGVPKGSTETGFLGNSYLSPAPTSDDTQTKKAVLIFTDAFGLNLPNPKLIADELANHLHCDVWVPDYFLGELWACRQV
jgi:carboxymethylenebutenolidase